MPGTAVLYLRDTSPSLSITHVAFRSGVHHVQTTFIPFPQLKIHLFSRLLQVFLVNV